MSHKLKIKIRKCELAKEKVELVGHIANEYGVAINLNKIEVFCGARVQESSGALGCFLGLSRYYTGFIAGFK